MKTNKRRIQSVLVVGFGIGAIVAFESQPDAQPSLECPLVSTNTTFSNAAFATDCGSSAATVTQCTTKGSNGVIYNSSTMQLTLPTQAGNFQAPPSTPAEGYVYFAAPGDYDRDGWDDVVASNEFDLIYLMRNQTITCGSGSTCSGSATGTGSASTPTVQTIPDAWWSSGTNVRQKAFRQPTTTGGVDLNIKAAATGGGYNITPLASADFDGDGWTDVASISLTHGGAFGSSPMWPTAARLFMNTKNCRDASFKPCGYGSLCTGQPANGACSGSGVAGSGVAWSETQLSCNPNQNTCPFYQATFAAYDLRAPANNGTGTAVAVAVSANSPTTSTPLTYKPGDFGPMNRPVTNIQTVDFDGDGDMDILYGHGTGTCPGTLCTNAGQVFYAGIAIWKNDCAQSAEWVEATKSCIGHIPQFTRNTTTCTAASCANADVLIPSTAHNTTTIAPSTNLGFNVVQHQTPGFNFSDIDKDGRTDLVLGSVGCCSGSTASVIANKLKIYKGTSSSAVILDTANPISLSTTSATYPGFEGALTAIFVHDFSGDGYPDIIAGTDAFSYNAAGGGRTRYWKNTGNSATPFGMNWPTCSATPASCVGCSATCNPSPTAILSNSCGTSGCASNLAATPPTMPDFDMGIMLDYDHDPSNTKDMIMTNTNPGNEFYVFPNRASAASVVACGTVTSGTLATPSEELTVSGACIAPSSTTPSGTAIKYSLSNDGGTTWNLACTQESSGYTPALVGGQCCVTFTNITNRAIQWKAELDSNTADGIGAPSGCGTSGAVAPTIANIATNYTYSDADVHYKAGVIVSDGVVYVGSFTQPGNRGKLAYVSADFGSTYAEVGAKIDAQGSRNIYTSDVTGVSPTRIDFSPTSPSTTLQGRVGASSATEATTIIDWVLSARFGVNNSGFTKTKLGAVVDSTPAILQKPFKPSWYTYMTAAERTTYDTFAATQSTRIPLLLFAAMDGMIHATYAISTSISDTRNGQEAWAFVPPYVAPGMKSDYDTSIATNTTTVTSYPDGSPAVLDYKRSDGQVRTVAIVSDGAGGTSLTALDVTQTVTATSATANSVQGPTPLWSAQPGGASAGWAHSKPGVARVKIGADERFIVIAGSGQNSTDNTKGMIVGGYNLETGALLWQFEMACALTSDITVFETDDLGELGTPAIDGYADRAVFADACGNVYKINPAQDLSGGYMGNAGYGGLALGTSNGVARFALFSTASTSGALGAASGNGGMRPITNTIGARADTTTDTVLFFGTGGMENFDASLTNEFYAVYAKNGSIRNKLTGTCSGGKCDKFYGGVVVSSDAIYLVRSRDAVIGSSTCDLGASRLLAYDINTLANQFEVSQINGSALAASSGPLFGDGGALYFATVAGTVERVGSPRAPEAGNDSTNGTMNNSGTAEPGAAGANTTFTLQGWRVVL